MRQVHVFLTLSQRHNLVDLLRQNPMQRVFGDGDEIGQRLALAGLLLPTDDAPVFSIARSEQVRRAETPCCWEDSITVRISSLVCSLIHRPVIGTTNPLVFLQDRQFDRQVGQGAFLVLEFAFECLVTSVLT